MLHSSKYKRHILFGAILVIFLINIFIFSQDFWKRYDTIEEAICASEKGVKKENIIEVLQDGNMAIGIFKTSDGVVNSTNFAVDRRGWYAIRNENVLTSKKIRKGSWNIWCNSYKGNYYVWIFVISDNPNIQPPEDTLNSEFQYYYIDANSVLSHEWFLVLDEKPENYAVTVDGETIELT